MFPGPPTDENSTSILLETQGADESYLPLAALPCIEVAFEYLPRDRYQANCHKPVPKKLGILHFCADMNNYIPKSVLQCPSDSKLRQQYLRNAIRKSSPLDWNLPAPFPESFAIQREQRQKSSCC